MKSDQKAKGNRGCLKGCGRLTLAYPILLIIGVFIIGDPHEDPYGMMAMNAVEMYAKECAVKKAMGEKNPAIKVTQLEKHKITPVDGNCDGDEKGLITALSTDLYKYPTFIYNIQTGEKTCFHNGVKWDVDEERHYHGCTAKKNGTWFEITNW